MLPSMTDGEGVQNEGTPPIPKSPAYFSRPSWGKVCSEHLKQLALTCVLLRSKKHRVQFMLSYDKDGRAVTLNSSGEDSEGEGGDKTGGERPYSPAKPEGTHSSEMGMACK